MPFVKGHKPYKKKDDSESAVSPADTAASVDAATDPGTTLPSAAPEQAEEREALAEAARDTDETEIDASEPEHEKIEFVTKLSAKEKAKLTKRAREKIQNELARKAADEYLELEMARLRAEAGLSQTKGTLAPHLLELVKFRVDLGDADTEDADPYLQINMPFGKKYFHGSVHDEPRHVYNTIMEMMFRLQLHNLNKSGKSVFRRRKAPSVVNWSQKGGVSVEREFGEIQ